MQVVSCLLDRGPEYLKELKEGLSQMLEKLEYNSIQQMRGNMSLARCPDPGAFKRRTTCDPADLEARGTGRRRQSHQAITRRPNNESFANTRLGECLAFGESSAKSCRAWWSGSATNTMRNCIHSRDLANLLMAFHHLRGRRKAGPNIVQLQ